MKEKRGVIVDKKKLMFYIALIVGFGSQINLDYNIPGFIITLAVILLALLIYIFDVSYHQTIFLTAFVSPIFRGIIFYLGNLNLQRTIYLVAPDIIFYLTFGFIFWLLKDVAKKGLGQYVLVVFIADITSNILEISFRLTPNQVFENNILNYLFIVAVIRATIVLIALVLHRSYHFFLKKEEHEKRYQKLLLLQSHFKSEIYFLEKNINTIEGIMKDAYQLHKLATKDPVKNLSLDIARNIHEVKKDYIRVIDGLHELSNPEDYEKVDSLLLKDLLDIILVNTREHIDKIDKKIHIKCNDLEKDYRVHKHYYLMSILRNLINNSIEAIASEGLIEIQICEKQNSLMVSIQDNGKGILKKNIDYIFNLGYSTKFKSGDGKSRRGMGLAIVKNLIENKFNGHLKVSSEIDQGSVFEIELPIQSL